jgi:hypothetical protein
MDPLELVETASRLAKERVAACPTSEVYESIALQVEYVRALLLDPNASRDRLEDITMGILAVRELEPSDPEFARHIREVSWLAERMRLGLEPISKPGDERSQVSLYRLSLDYRKRKIGGPKK